MLSRTHQLTRLIPKLSAVQASRNMGEVVPSASELLKRDRENNMTMDALPLPEGSWQENYNKKQRYYNIYLGTSIAIMLSVGLFGYKLQAFRLYEFEVPADRK